MDGDEEGFSGMYDANLLSFFLVGWFCIIGRGSDGFHFCRVELLLLSVCV